MCIFIANTFLDMDCYRLSCIQFVLFIWCLYLAFYFLYIIRYFIHKLKYIHNACTYSTYELFLITEFQCRFVDKDNASRIITLRCNSLYI